MTRLSTDDAPTHWLDGLPEREMYDIYADTIAKRFPAFQIRSFDETLGLINASVEHDLEDLSVVEHRREPVRAQQNAVVGL